MSGTALVDAETRSTTAGPDGRLVVLYDRDCGLCTATARWLRRRDAAGRLELMPLQDAAASSRPAVAAMAVERPLGAALHVLDERTGEIRAGGEAMLAIGRALPGGSVVRLMGAVPPARWVIGRAYDVVARNRHRIGRLLRLEGPACDLPQ